MKKGDGDDCQAPTGYGSGDQGWKDRLSIV